MAVFKPEVVTYGQQIQKKNSNKQLEALTIAQSSGINADMEVVISQVEWIYTAEIPMTMLRF